MIVVTKMIPENATFTEQRVNVHHTKDLRRIVRKYCDEWDCAESSPGVLRPNNGATWRLHVGMVA